MTNDPSMTKVRRWMTPSPLTIDDSASIVEAIHRLKEKNIRRLPVMRGGKLVGVVTEKMLKDFTPSKATSLDTWEVHYLLARTPVTAAMNPKPHKVRPDDEIALVAKLMEDRKLNGVLVVDEKDDLVGILTTSNCLEALIGFANAFGK
ncbi:MAG: histidine kinase [Anaeromyxobacteraceae bacterium]|jgi:acetoin utilization protein AcuB|nr:histidine kinase [Anaeromyxobacteraceae bacterium]